MEATSSSCKIGAIKKSKQKRLSMKVSSKVKILCWFVCKDREKFIVIRLVATAINTDIRSSGLLGYTAPLPFYCW